MGKIYDGILRGMNWLSDILNKICSVIVAVIGAVMAASLLWGVFTRFVLHAPAIWTEEVARFCMVWLAFIGCSIVMKKKDLTSLNIIVDRLPPRGKKTMEIVGTLLVLSYVVIFMISGKDAMKIFMRAKASATKVPLVYPAAGLYIGAFVIGVHGITQLLEQIKEYVLEFGRKGGK